MSQWARRRGAVFAAALLLAVASACAPPDTPRNVVLIVVDTLRWDHVGSYGASERDVSPQLDAFAREAVRFERAYATAPWTRPSIGSMITGLMPSAHGGTAVDRPLPADAVTLAELLSGAGYATRAVVSNWVISRKNGFDQGYEVYHEAAAARRQAATSTGVTNVARGMLDDLAGGERPFLLFVHYFDPHYRYLPHEGAGFADGEVGRIAEHPSIFRIRSLGPTLSDEEIANLRALYAEEVHHTDAEVGRLLAHVDALGLADTTVVAVVSDHGEEIFERGYLGHAHSLAEELIRVPFLLRAPGLAPAVVREPVSLLSLTPTLLALAHTGVEIDLPGRVLPPRASADATAAPLLAEVDYRPDKRVERNASLRALIGPRWKLVLDRDTDAVTLHDLENDPGETADVAAAHPGRSAALRRDLEARMARIEATRVGGERIELSAEDAERLRELGYLGGLTGAELDPGARERPPDLRGVDEAGPMRGRVRE